MTRLRRSSPLRPGRPGMTLIELLVVVFILVLFVALAAPLMRPATADRKVREASRLLNAYVAEAKAYAAQRGRSVGLAFDRRSAANEGARNPNVITRLYLSESPPNYTGDVEGATVTPVRLDSTQIDAIVSGPQMPPWYQANITPPTINSNVAAWFRLDRTAPASSAMLDVIINGYLGGSTTGHVPFRVRIGARGPFYDGYCYVDTAGPTHNYYLWAPYGTQAYSSSGGTASLFEFEFFPQINNSSPLELPTGTVIDLRYSGNGLSGNEFNGATTDTNPLMLIFSPSGNVERVIANGSMGNNITRMHFLIGTDVRAIDQTGLADSNLVDGMNQWVSVSARTGHVTTADNTPPTDFTTAATAIAQARSFATSLNTKGGR